MNAKTVLPREPKEGWSYSEDSALILAAGRQNLDFVKLLVENGADIQYCSRIRDSALYNAISRAENKKGVELVRYFLDLGCDPKLTASGRNLLTWAAWNKYARGIISELVSRGADPNAVDEEWGSTPLQRAIEEANVRGVMELLDNGADPHQRWPVSDREWSEMTSIEFAKKLRKKKILAILEDAGPATPGGKPSKATKKKAAKKAASPRIPSAAASWTKLEKHLKASQPEVFKTLNEPATSAQINKLIAKTKIRITKDVKEFFERHNGQSYEAELINLETEDERFRLLSIDEALHEWATWQALAAVGDFDDRDASPDDGVRECWWHAKWIPFADNGGGDFLCFDCSPAKGGKQGQVITLWHERADRAVAFPCVRHFLADLIDQWQPTDAD